MLDCHNHPNSIPMEKRATVPSKYQMDIRAIEPQEPSDWKILQKRTSLESSRGLEKMAEIT